MAASSKIDKPAQPEQVVQRLLSASQLPPFVLILCSSPLRRARVLETFLKKIADVPAKHWEGKDINLQSLSRLVEGLASLSLFSTRELHILKNVQDLSSDLCKRLTTTLEKVPEAHPSTLFVLGSELKAANPLLSLARKQQVSIELTALEGSELARWAQGECKRHRVSIDAPLLEQLVEGCSGSPDLLAQKIEHLALYSDGKVVQPRDIQVLFPGNGASSTEFEFVDAVLDRKFARAEELLTQLLRGGSNQFGILALLQRAYASGLQISYLKKAGITDEHMARQLGMPVWLLRKQAPRALRNGPARLRKGLELMLRCDSRMKNQSLGPDLLMSELVQQLSA